MRLSIATSIPDNNYELVARPPTSKTGEYATAHVPTVNKVQAEALKAIKRTDELRKTAGEEPLTESERRVLIEQELDNARAHEIAHQAETEVSAELIEKMYPGPNYASKTTQMKAIKKVEDRLKKAQQTVTSTDRAMLSSLRKH